MPIIIRVKPKPKLQLEEAGTAAPQVAANPAEIPAAAIEPVATDKIEPMAKPVPAAAAVPLPDKGECRKSCEKSLKRIRAALAMGQTKKAQHLGRQYLHSFCARYVATEKAYRSLRPEAQPGLQQLPLIASSLNAWTGTTEEVKVFLKPKEGHPGDFRTIFEFGLENRALQNLVASLLKVHANLHPSQYGMRGTHAAIQRVVRLMMEGYAWAIETDIKDCYPSFDGDQVEKLLPIPKEVTRHVLFCGTLSLRTDPNAFGPASAAEDEEFFAAGPFADVRRGFPQGSAASPLAVEMLLASLYGNLPQEGRSIGYADNFLALGKTEHEAVSMTKALRSAIKAHSAGQLGPKPPRRFKPGQAVEFLGHRLLLKDGSVRISPSVANQHNFDRKLDRGLHKIKKASNGSSRAREIANIRRFVSGWCEAFKLCTEIGAIRESALKRIADVTADLPHLP